MRSSHTRFHSAQRWTATAITITITILHPKPVLHVKLQLPSSISTKYACTITLVAELTRNRYDTTELMSLSVGNVVVVPNLDPFEDAFHSHRIEFTATAATLTLNFTNVSPAGVYARMH
jgi:hypothetical protein